MNYRAILHPLNPSRADAPAGNPRKSEFLSVTLKTVGNAFACPDFGVLASDEAHTAVRIGVRFEEGPTGGQIRESNRGLPLSPPDPARLEEIVGRAGKAISYQLREVEYPDQDQL